MANHSPKKTAMITSRTMQMRIILLAAPAIAAAATCQQLAEATPRGMNVIVGTGSERSNNPPGCPNAEPCETSARTLFWSTDPFADHYHQDATSSSSVVGTDQLLLLFAAFR